jgi:NADH:ubiquinone oxidoreductase subunit E
MSLPIVGTKKTPDRPPTHTELDAARMMRVANDLEEDLAMRGEDALSPELVEEIAAEHGIRESHFYVAAATWSQIPCAGGAEIEFTMCVGNCQKWGAVELLERVLDVDGRRRADGKPGFGIVAKACLDRCGDAPVVLIRTPDGTAGLAPATLASLDEALELV